MLNLSSTFQVFKAYGFTSKQQLRRDSRVFSVNTQHWAFVGNFSFPQVTFHRAITVSHVCWPTCFCAIKGLDFCFHLHFFLVLSLYLVYTTLLFCYMCKLFQTACVRKQNINKQDPMILHLKIIFRVFLRKGVIQHNITGRLQISELYLKLHLWAVTCNSDFFFSMKAVLQKYFFGCKQLAVLHNLFNS